MASRIAGVVDVALGELEEVEVRNTVELAIRRQLDALGFTTASGYDVELDAIGPRTGPPRILGPQVEELVGEAGSGVSFADLHALAGTSEPLTRALGDLREAIRKPYDTAFFCYRAVEALRGPFDALGTSDAPNWATFRNALRVEETSLRVLAERAKSERHGELLDVTRAYRVGAMRFARAILQRYVAYLRIGSIADQVPMLSWPDAAKMSSSQADAPEMISG